MGFFLFFGGGGGARAGLLKDSDKLYTYVQCTVGGFNVSNLMVITRRKIDIGEKITFYFLQNV